MDHKNILARAISLALAGGTLAVSFASPIVIAAEEQNAQKVERIEVTGSRIKRTDMESASPVLVMNRDEIAATGKVSIGDILQQIPAAGAALNTAFNNGGNGATNMDLRNLGAQRLLVLVNGRRWIAGMDSTVDLNSIPTSAVERIEVLKDGASAVYGSDAIAGVVNIITRKDFQGVEVSLYGGENASERDGRQYTADITLGVTSDKGGILFNMSHVTQQPVWAGDRDISSVGYSSTGPDTRLQIDPSILNATNQAALAANYTLRSTGKYDLMALEGTGANTSLNSFRDRASGTADSYNYAPDNYLITPQNRNAFYIQGFYDIADNLRFVSDFMMTNRKSSQELAPMPVTLGAQFGASGSRVDISADNIYNPFGETLYGDTSRAVEAGYSADYVPYALQRRMIEAGSRHYDQNDTTYRAMVGFEGSFAESWSWSAHYIYGQNDQSEYTTGLLNLTRVNQALGANCTAASGCVPLNLFGGPGTITQDMIDYITFDSVARSGMTMKDYAFNLSGDLFELPAGIVGVAFGIERREETGFDTPDPLTVTGESSGNQRDATSGGFRLDEAYVELSIPVLENLLVTPAIRYSDHDVYGSKNTAKVGVEYRPFDDLLLRGTWAEGYRAPSISDLYAGNSDDYPSWTDPCNTRDDDGNPIDISGLPGCVGVQDGYVQGNSQIRVTRVSSPDLKPETSESVTAGIVYNPNWLEGAELTVDYYKIRVNDAIGRIGYTRIADGCATGDEADLCQYIDRDSTGNIVDLRNFLLNANQYKVEGVDVYTGYRFDSNYGDFKVSMDMSYVISNKFNGEEQVGIQYGDGGYPRIKGNVYLDWAYNDWDAHWRARYVHHLDNYYATLGYQEYYPGIADGAGHYIVHDVSVGYNLPVMNTRLSIGVNNLFAKKPEREYTNNDYAVSSNNFSVTEYDPNMDRFVYMRATMKF
jgi:iron complex outermembrane receptor protein